MLDHIILQKLDKNLANMTLSSGHGQLILMFHLLKSQFIALLDSNFDRSFPINIIYSHRTGFKPKLTLQTLDSTNRTMSTRSRDSILAVPCKLLSYGVAHTVALRLIYPGSVSIVSWAMSEF